MASPSWSTLFLHATVENLLKYNSDHSPILLKLHQKPNNRKTQSKAFKFETSWLFDETCEQVVHDAWGDSEGSLIVAKLVMVGRKLKVWSKGKYDNLGKQIERTEKALRVAQ